MQIIFGKDNADILREKYLVFDLDSFDVNGQILDTYCVLAHTAIPIDDLENVDRLIKVHNAMVHEIKKDNYSFAEQAIEHLMGHFGGELDTFYTELLTRVEKKKLENT